MVKNFIKIRKQKKVIASSLLLIFCFQLGFQFPAWAHGPSNPEMGSFTPFEASEWVNKFSGDFNYSIPLFEVGGYPMNLSYSSSTISPEASAGWVGLGWSLNPGVINRGMRAIPDDFKPEKDVITQVDRMRNNKRISLGISGELSEIVGVKMPPGLELTPSARLDIFTTTYAGLGFNFGVGVGLGGENLPGFVSKLSPQGRIGLQFGTESGISVTPELSVSYLNETASSGLNSSISAGSSVSATYNSRSGQTQLNLNYIGLSGKLANNQSVLSSIRPMSASVGSRFTSASRSYIPSSHLPVINKSVSVSLGAGFEFSWANLGVHLHGTFSDQLLADATNDVLKRSLMPHGYLYYNQHEDYNKEDGVYDFNRENDYEIDDKTPAINLSHNMYDMFSVMAQGLSGSYRLKQNGVTVISDGYSNLNGKDNGKVSSRNFGAEIGFGAYGKGAVNLGTTVTEGHYSGWNKSDLPFFENFTAPANYANSKYQEKYMMQIGVGTKPDEGLYTALHREKAFKISTQLTDKLPVDYNSLRESLKTQPTLVNSDRISNSIQASYHDQKRIQQAQPLQFFTAMEASTLGLRKERFFFDRNLGKQTSLPRVDEAKGIYEHHFSELRVLKNNGDKYIFGLPAYNLEHKEVSFNVSQIGSGHLQSGSELARYTTTVTNGDTYPAGRGVTHFLNQRSYSPYAYAFHLTEVLSHDYFDVDGNGLTPNDLGNYVKFDYIKWSDSFKWKSPSAINEIGRSVDKRHRYCNLNEGKASDYNDDVGSYTYGAKEVFYLKSMESKDKVIIFHVNESKDPQAPSNAIHYSESLSGEHGNYNKEYLGRLDSIQIFTRVEWEQKQSPIPEQSIHFRYSYELCKNATQVGKLTLKRIFSTYRYSQKSAMSGYQFKYGDSEINNPNYESYNRDRWGTYQQRSGPSPTSPLSSRAYSNIEYPFTEQSNRELSNLNASVYHLTDIRLPSGGTMKVSYESDDFAFVQNKRAGIVYPIAGFGSTAEFTSNSTLYEKHLLDILNEPHVNNNYVFVDITDHFDNAKGTFETPEDFWKEAVGNLREVPIRCLVDITGSEDYEFVVTYAEIQDFGVYQSNGSQNNGSVFGYVKLREESINKKPGKLQPILKQAIQVAYNQFNDKIYKGTLNPGNNPNIKNVVEGLRSFRTEVDAIIKGRVGMALDRGFGLKTILDGRSLMVLGDPMGHKIGGGSRVKEIILIDHWDKFTNQENQAVGATKWIYNYDTEEFRNGTTVNISSGVAEWEPELGSIENTALQSVKIRTDKFLEPSGAFYQLQPYGRTVFPGANVGYSKVRVTKTGFDPEEPDAPITPISTTQCGFFTAKDFPVTVDKTALEFDKKPQKFNTKISFNGNKYVSVALASQGFSIVLNDMHGKQKEVLSYRGNETFPYKQVRYKYQTDGSLLSPELNTRKTFINELGHKSNVLSNLDFDVTIDSKEYYRLRRNFHEDFNIDLSPIPIVMVPLILPSWFNFNDEEVVFARSITCTKVISKYGVLEEIESFEDGGRFLQRNLAYDYNTGEAIVTETNNEFGEPLFNVTLPAYWMYPEFGPANERNGIHIKIQDFNEVEEILRYGDVLYDINNLTHYQLYKDQGEFKTLDLSTGLNAELNLAGQEFLLLAEGSKNYLNAVAGQITMLNNPILGNQLLLDGNHEYLNAEYQTFNMFDFPSSCLDCEDDPFSGYPDLKKVAKHYRWYPEATYKPFIERTYNDNSASYPYFKYEMSSAGVLASYPKFWYIHGYKWQQINVSSKPQNWLVNRVIRYNHFGQTEEVENWQNIKNSLSWGHNQTLTRFKVLGSEINEVYLEDFEMNDSDNCDDRRRIKYHNETITSDDQHTGENALVIHPRNQVTVNIEVE